MAALASFVENIRGARSKRDMNKAVARINPIIISRGTRKNGARCFMSKIKLVLLFLIIEEASEGSKGQTTPRDASVEQKLYCMQCIFIVELSIHEIAPKNKDGMLSFMKKIPKIILGFSTIPCTNSNDTHDAPIREPRAFYDPDRKLDFGRSGINKGQRF